MESEGTCYRCSKCSLFGPVKELEKHLAEQHYGYRPHHCHTCGIRTYDRAAIFEQCGSLEHNVGLWEAREEVMQSQIAEELKKCLSQPIILPELKPSLLANAITVSIEPADSAPQPRAIGLGSDNGRIDVPSANSVPTSNGGKSRRISKIQAHTFMTCHYTGCGEKVVLRGKNAAIDAKKRHIQECHLGEQTKDVRCPVARCIRAQEKGNFAYIELLSGHIRKSHGGVDTLKEEERASYQAMQRRLRDACAELIPACFPPGAIIRDQTRTRATSRCAMCGESVKGFLRDLRKSQKRHIETRHVEAGHKINCPIEGCRKTCDNFVCLEWHINGCHGRIDRLSKEQLAKHHAVRRSRNAAIDTIFADYFPDQAGSS